MSIKLDNIISQLSPFLKAYNVDTKKIDDARDIAKNSDIDAKALEEAKKSINLANFVLNSIASGNKIDPAFLSEAIRIRSYKISSINDKEKKPSRREERLERLREKLKKYSK